MRTIITGGTGLIGTALSESLLADGHEVIVLSRTPETRNGLPQEVRVVGWDARTAEGWGHLADGAGAIVNLAGANLAGSGFLPSRWTEERKRVIRDSRVNAGRAVVAAVEQAARKPGVLVQASGIGYYGGRGDEVLTEEADAGDDWLARLAAEEWEPSTAAVEDMGVRRVIIRSGAVFSAEEGALPRLALPFRLFVGGRLGSGRQYHAWIHLQDEVRAIRFLVEREEASGAFNVVAPDPKTNAELARTLGRVLNRPAWVPVPAFAMRLAFGEVAGVLLEGQRALPRRLLDLGFEFRFPDAESALRDLLK
ncbi:MAG: TIGR01777 family oxidoreductase [Anaerolineae bacterium]